MIRGVERRVEGAQRKNKFRLGGVETGSIEDKTEDRCKSRQVVR